MLFLNSALSRKEDMMGKRRNFFVKNETFVELMTIRLRNSLSIFFSYFNIIFSPSNYIFELTYGLAILGRIDRAPLRWSINKEMSFGFGYTLFFLLILSKRKNNSHKFPHIDDCKWVHIFNSFYFHIRSGRKYCNTTWIKYLQFKSNKVFCWIFANANSVEYISCIKIWV